MNSCRRRHAGLLLSAATALFVVILLNLPLLAEPKRCQQECDAALETCITQAVLGCEIAPDPNWCEGPVRDACDNEFWQCTSGAYWCYGTFTCQTWLMWVHAPSYINNGTFDYQWTTCYYNP